MNAQPKRKQSQSDDDLPPAPPIPRKKKKSTEPEVKRGRPAWVRYLIWGVMLCLALAAVIELRAQFYFKHNLRVAQEALYRTTDAPKKVTYGQIRDRIWSTPEITKGQGDFTTNVIYTWSWRGIRKYEVRLYVNPKDGQLYKVESEP